MCITFKISTAVFPLVEPNIFEVPSSPNNSSSSTDPPLSLTLQPGESFQWTCAVSAGVEDQLVWLRDGEPIPPSSKTTGSEVSGETSFQWTERPFNVAIDSGSLSIGTKIMAKIHVFAQITTSTCIHLIVPNLPRTSYAILFG